MRRIIAVILSMLLIMTACGGKSMSQNGYKQITQQQAKEMMDKQSVIILDVREQHEYDSGHIKGAVLLPVGSITEQTAAAVRQFQQIHSLPQTGGVDLATWNALANAYNRGFAGYFAQ